MAKPITTTTSTGTIKAFDKRTDPMGIKYGIRVLLDNSTEELVTTSDVHYNVSVGDKVKFTVTDGPLGKEPSEFKKIT
ncbi:hypothetical protein ACYZT3_03280 [Pseudomonas sp. MDT1-16]